MKQSQGKRFALNVWERTATNIMLPGRRKAREQRCGPITNGRKKAFVPSAVRIQRKKDCYAVGVTEKSGHGR
jgi:hypothetical protein